MLTQTALAMNDNTLLTVLIIGGPIAIVLLQAFIIPMLTRPLDRKVDRDVLKAGARVKRRMGAADDQSSQFNQEQAGAPRDGTPASAIHVQTRVSPQRRRASGEFMIGIALLVNLVVLIEFGYAVGLIFAVALGVAILMAKRRTPEPTKIPLTPTPSRPSAGEVHSQTTGADDDVTPVPGPAGWEARDDASAMQIVKVEMGADDALVDALGIDIVSGSLPIAAPAEALDDESVCVVVAMEDMQITVDASHGGENGEIVGGKGLFTFTDRRLLGVLWETENAGPFTTSFSVDAEVGTILAFSVPREALNEATFGRLQGGFTTRAGYESMRLSGQSIVSGQPLLLLDLDDGEFNRTAQGGLRLAAESFVEDLPMPSRKTVKNLL